MAASNKTVDRLNVIDRAALAVASKIGNRSDDVPKLLSKVSKYEKIFNVASKVGGTVEVVGGLATLGFTIYNAVDAYNNGDPDNATAIIVGATTELAVGVVGKDDGLLVRDVNGNGFIDNGNELLVIKHFYKMEQKPLTDL